MLEGLITYPAHEFLVLLDVLDVLLGDPAVHNLHVLCEVELGGHLLVADGALVLLSL